MENQRRVKRVGSMDERIRTRLRAGVRPSRSGVGRSMRAVCGKPAPCVRRTLMFRRTPRISLRVMFLPQIVAAVIDLNGRQHYVHSGWFLISVANLIVIVAMLAVFALAIALPFPHGSDEEH
jgi:hypothetical protein